MEVFSKFLFVGGLLFILYGLSFAGKLGPFGKLPGDIRINRPNFKFYLPLTTNFLFLVLLNFVVKIF
jgi:hypothetical protein